MLFKITSEGIASVAPQDETVRYLPYFNIVWGICSTTHLKIIYLLQTRAMRIITGSAPLSHTDPLFKKVSVLKLHDINKLQIANVMFSYLHQ